MGSRSEEMFTLRRPRPNEISELRTLLTTFFESGELGQELCFGELEMEDYLDWFLPRALLDQSRLLLVLEYHPRSSARSYKSKLVGCSYVDLSRSNTAVQVQRSFELWKLRLYNKIGDVQIWPNRQAAEVHRRLQRVIEFRTADSDIDEDLASLRADLLFVVIQQKYRGLGLGTKMVSWTIELIKELGVEGVAFRGRDREAQFMSQCGFNRRRRGSLDAVCTMTI